MSAYIPPHKRRDEKDRPSPESTIRHKIDIKWAQGCIPRARSMVLSRPGVHVSLKRFLGESYHHLEGRTLYTAGVENELQGAENEQEKSLSESFETSLRLNDPHARIQKQLAEDLVNAIAAMQKDVDSEREMLRPKLEFRIGKMIFHFGARDFSGRFQNIDAGKFEKDISEGELSRGRSFDLGLQIDAFNEIKNRVLEGCPQVVENDYFLVKVEDKTGLGQFRCKFIRNNANGLQLKNIKSDPVLRHFVGDVLRVEKNHDMRVILYTQKYPNLTPDQRSSLDDLLKTAVVEDNVKGGLHWRGMGNRFRVSNVFHMKQTSARSSEKKWKFLHASRSDLNTSHERLTYEITCEDLKFRDFLREFSPVGAQDTEPLRVLCSMMDTI